MPGSAANRSTSRWNATVADAVDDLVADAEVHEGGQPLGRRGQPRPDDAAPRASRRRM